MIPNSIQEHIQTLLTDADESRRRQAAEDLSLSNNLMVSAVLSLALQDSDKGVRDAASRSLLQLPHKTSALAIVEYLTDSNFTTRNLASKLLVEIGDDSVAPLLDYVNHENPDVKKLAIDTIGLIGSPKAVSSLLPLFFDADENVVVAAIEALGNIRDRSVIPQLTTAYVCYPYARVMVAEAFGKIADVSLSMIILAMLRELENRDGDNALIAYALVEALAQCGNEKAIPELEKIIDDTSGRLQHVLIYSYIILAERYHLPFDELHTSHFIQILSDEDEKIVFAGVRALTALTKKRILPEVVRLFGSYGDIDAYLINVMLQQNIPFIELFPLYSSFSNDEKKTSLIKILPHLKERTQTETYTPSREDNALFDILLQDWHSADNELRSIIVDVLFFLNEEKAFESIVPLVNEMDGWSRVEFLQLASNATHQRNGELLMRYLDDPEEMVREFVQSVLMV
ncbi:MAG: HEAT repeat domain-containing protein [Bacteroidetes bacterium]|nr:HEAT repeat domain-containing protein [Bacteroidota bacterium]